MIGSTPYIGQLRKIMQLFPNILQLEILLILCGRNVRFQIPFKSKWHNPYTVEKTNGKEVPGSREKAIRQYKEYILNKPELLRLIPIELKDKVLGW